MRAGRDSCLASAQPARAAAYVSAQSGLPLRCLHAGVLPVCISRSHTCMVLQRKMTCPVATTDTHSTCAVKKTVLLGYAAWSQLRHAARAHPC